MTPPWINRIEDAGDPNIASDAHRFIGRSGRPMCAAFEADTDHADSPPDTRTPIAVTPDLAEPARALAPVFPRGGRGTRLVLYPGRPGELRVSWSLRANDVVGYGAGFPAADGRPRTLLRLRRLRPWGGSELIHEIGLHAAGFPGLGGDGERVFWVGDDDSRFEAELGLANAEGGWLLLARSNPLQHARGIGLECLARPHPNKRAPRRIGRDPRTIQGSMDLPRWTPPTTSAARDEPPRLALSPDDPVGAGMVRIGADDLPRWTPPVAVSNVEETDSTARDMDLDGVAHRETPTVRLQASIPPLTYGQPAVLGGEPIIEAELRIFGWGAPNSEIDLFGHPYRVGPGGRFQLTLRVDDPDLLRRALARHPPPELDVQRND